MRHRSLVFSMCSLILLASHSGVQAQYTFRSLERLGLEHSWSTTAETDPTIGGISGTLISVNHDETKAYQVFHVVFDGGEVRFSQFDLGSDGVPMGVEEAKRRAEVELLKRQSLGQNPKLETTTTKRIDLFVSTTGSVLQSINAETGQTNWSVMVGNPRYPTSSPAANDWYVAVINGSRLYVLNRENGEPVFDRQLESSPMVGTRDSDVGPVMTNYGFDTVNEKPESIDWIYVPCIHGRLEGYRVGDEDAPPWFTTTKGDLFGRPVVGAGLVAWTSSSGYLMAASALTNEMRFRLQTGSRIDASAAYLPPNRFVAATRDGYVYGVDAKSENIAWKFSTAQPIVKRPVGVENDVFAVTMDDNIYCIAADSGLEQWTVPAIDSFLAASKERVYVIDTRGQLVVLNRKTGAPFGRPIRVNAGPIINTVTDRIYVASTLADIYCFREVGSEFPTVFAVKEAREAKPAGRRDREPRKPESPVDPDAQPDVTTELPGVDAPMTEPADDNPFDFGDEPAADPGVSEDLDESIDMEDEDENPFDFE